MCGAGLRHFFRSGRLPSSSFVTEICIGNATSFINGSNDTNFGCKTGAGLDFFVYLWCYKDVLEMDIFFIYDRSCVIVIFLFIWAT